MSVLAYEHAFDLSMRRSIQARLRMRSGRARECSTILGSRCQVDLRRGQLRVQLRKHGDTGQHDTGRIAEIVATGIIEAAKGPRRPTLPPTPLRSPHGGS